MSMAAVTDWTTVLNGNTGNNVLAGGLGNDTLAGAGGSDTFLFNSTLNSSNVDLIKDFSSDDKLSLSHLIFDQLTAGTIDPALFKAGAGLTTGQDANDYLVYNTTTGNLYYDADGSGAGGSILFAQLGTTTHPSLTATMIQVV